MDSVNKSVKLENEDTILIYKSDMIYTMTNKNTNETIIGRRGLQTDITMESGTTYLLEANPEEMTRDQFLKDSNYSEISEYRFKVISCNADQVTYEYIRPVELEGDKVTFSIEQLD